MAESIPTGVQDMSRISPKGPFPSISTSVARTPIIIPENMFLRVYTNGGAVTFALTDRYNQSIPVLTPVGAAGYYFPFYDFDGRTFATVTPSIASPYALLLRGSP